MKIMLLSKNRGIPGTYGGPIQLGILLQDVKLTDHEIARASGFGLGDRNDEYVLSLRDEVWLTCLPKKGGEFPDHTGSFELGEAKALIMQSLDSGGRLMLKIAIEGANTADFVDLYNTIYARLGVRHEVIPIPRKRLDDISFVRGIRNDLRSLGKFLSCRWRALADAAKRRVYGTI
ncbi:MAG: hypothetical protein KBD06_02785 [Candidatus Pacebacteria bacterium]|nr:hypothetical protein [Candidatus Paceibacterota bacterium]